MNQMVLFAGGSAVGKTAVIQHVISHYQKIHHKTAVCKIDCLQTKDGEAYRSMGVPCVVGLSQDICPDHFMVSNLPEIWNWSQSVHADSLFLETAGLCHRCSPATEHMLAGCVLDCMSSMKAPSQLGPMLTQADFLVLTRIDMVSQAELEIVCWKLKDLNARAPIFRVDGLNGFGADLLADYLLGHPYVPDMEEDTLRHSMPSGVCSYCVGETRVGSAYQQGVVGKIDFSEAAI